MRIGFVIYGSLETRSGGYLYDRKLVAYLRQQGDEVILFSQPWRNYARRILHNFDGAWADAMARARLDILIQDELNHPSLFLRNRDLRTRVPAPIMALVHHLRSDEAHAPPLMPLYRAVEARYLRSVDGFIYNSRSTQASVLSLAGIERPGVVAYPGREAQAPPLSEADIQARAQQPGPLRLLFVGNLIPRKGLHILLDALAHLPSAMAQLTVVGDAALNARYSRHVRAQARRLGLESRIDWRGPVSDAVLHQLYASHHALAVPSQHEGFGIVYLEAMGYGLIAVGSEAGGAGEIIRPGETGLLIPPGDADALATRLWWLHQHRREMGHMGVAARQTWLTHPTWEETAARIRAFLIEMSHASLR
ncbi:MAG TPA: glycosyltransferase family 1 protein [Anaerolineae bacterium]|nr:glycosyltransferase family 4 protein [Caldilineae bacterium]HID33589.1 glycosyltransferase family 1 protein [Anaerolineae bacterium]